MSVEATAAPDQTAAPKKPSRIVSLNMCVDELLLRLVPASRIASVTWLSRDEDTSNVADHAAQVPVNHGLAEEVIPLAPDLVIVGTFTSRMASALLKRAGVPLLELDIPNNIAGWRAQVLETAALLDERERGEQLVSDIDRRLAALGPVNATDRPRAIVLNPNGFAPGPGSLTDETLARAGLENIAAHINLGSDQRIPLEVLVNEDVDVLIVNARLDGPPALATELLSHPVLSQLAPRTRIVVMPARFWGCPGPSLVEAIERLKVVADDIRARRTPR